MQYAQEANGDATQIEMKIDIFENPVYTKSIIHSTKIYEKTLSWSIRFAFHGDTFWMR